MTSEVLLHYNCLSEFQKQYKGKVLDFNHLDADGMVHFKSLAYPDGDTSEEGFWGWILRKDGNSYLISNTDKEGNKIELKNILPIIPVTIQEVAASTKVYHRVLSYQTVKYKKEKKISFKELINTLSDFKHGNPTHKRISTIIGVASYCERIYTRYCTEPGFGKDSIVDILGHLVGNCSTVENPTVAKLYYESMFRKWLAINEIVDIRPNDWMDIEQYLLAAGAFKPTINKRSRSTSDTGEEMDISDLSITLMYNDLTDYPLKKQKKYFDSIAKKAVLDRFPAMRFTGRLESSFLQVENVDVSPYVKQKTEDYKDLIYTIMYFKKFYKDELMGYDTSKLMKLPQRWTVNMLKILKFVDLYCSSQEEFDSYVLTINDCILDYKAMLAYPKMLEVVTQQLGQEEVSLITKKFIKDGINKFSTKIKRLDNALKGEQTEQESINNW